MIRSPNTHVQEAFAGGRTDVIAAATEAVENAVREALEDRWQPIETAPKGGTEILAYSEHGCTGTMLVRYIAPCDFLMQSELEEMSRVGISAEDLETADWYAADFIEGECLSPDCHPTHWMHLPSPPVPQPGDGQWLS
jgi:hypothetical protein